ncbi:MAG: hypothetical protein ABIK13_03755 [Patescibacteria group bacterium]
MWPERIGFLRSRQRRHDDEEPEHDREVVLEIRDVHETMHDERGNHGERKRSSASPPEDEEPRERDDAEEPCFAPEVQEDVMRILEDLHPCRFVIRGDDVGIGAKARAEERTVPEHRDGLVPHDESHLAGPLAEEDLVGDDGARRRDHEEHDAEEGRRDDGREARRLAEDERDEYGRGKRDEAAVALRHEGRDKTGHETEP